MGSAYNKDEDEQYLMYYDVNNLYGWAMMQPLPCSNFSWVENIDDTFWDVPEDSLIGYFLEVDLEYPHELHDKHKDFPFCAEHRCAPGGKHKKLMTTLHNKERYVIHYRALQQVLKHGLVLKKIHRALRFRQKPWLKTYIDYNSMKRKEAKNEFEKMLYKLFNNAVYGKTMENERKRVDVKLVNKWEGRYGAEAYISKPNFHSRLIFDENCVAIQLNRTSIEIKKPIYIGFAVLELSKTCVYRFHYDFMKPHLNTDCTVLYMDTDSLIYSIKNNDVYEFMKQHLDEFDTSDYDKNNVYNIPQVNKKIPGLMKDECNGNIMLRFMGLRSKMYYVKINGEKAIQKAKGVKSNVVKNQITAEDYEKALFGQETIVRKQRTIRSRLHNIHTEEQQKVALSSHDDKRFLIRNSTNTLPWGHYKIPQEEEEDSEPPTKKFKNN